MDEEIILKNKTNLICEKSRRKVVEKAIKKNFDVVKLLLNVVLELRMNDEEQASFEKDRAHLPKKLTGAQAWYGPDMLSSKKWIYSLSDQDINEINIALKTTENMDIAAITKEDFQLPNLSQTLREIQNQEVELGNEIVETSKGWPDEKTIIIFLKKNT